MHRLVFLLLTAFIVFSAEVDRMSLTLVTTLVLFEKALCNGSADVSVVARCFLEIKVSREAVKELTFANIW